MAWLRYRNNRIETDLNGYLESVIPIVYGAVLSYVIYTFSMLTLSVIKHYSSQVNLSPTLNSIDIITFIKRLLIVGPIFVFMVKDIGELIKLNKISPYTRSSRYVHEIYIAILYLITFVFLEIGSYLSLTVFSATLFWGGIWCNQMRQEYYPPTENGNSDAHDESKLIFDLSKTLRNLQYAGASILFSQSAYFYLVHHTESINTWEPVILFCISFSLWFIAYEKIPVWIHGNEVLKYTVIITPDRFIYKA